MCRNNRSYIRNQVLSFFLILLCGGLALGSVLLIGHEHEIRCDQSASSVFPVWAFARRSSKSAAIPMTILSLCRYLLGAAEAGVYRSDGYCRSRFWSASRSRRLKYLFLFAWPWMGRKFQNEYGPFYYAVSVVVFGVISAFIVLAGAEWSARPLNEYRRTPLSREVEKARPAVPIDFGHRPGSRAWHPHVSEAENGAIRAR